MSDPIYLKIAFFTRGIDPDFDRCQMCEVCQKQYANDVDHIYGRRGPLMYDPRFLMFVCRECHSRKLDSEEKKRRVGIVKSRLVWQHRDAVLYVLYQFYGNYDQNNAGRHKVQDLSIQSISSPEDRPEEEQAAYETPTQELERILSELSRESQI